MVRQRAPVASTTVRDFSEAPFSSLTSTSPPGAFGGNEAHRLLQVHHVDVIVLDVLFQAGGELGPFGVRDGDEVLDRQGVQHLAAETLGGDAGADALARGIDGRRRTGRAAAHDQHVEDALST